MEERLAASVNVDVVQVPYDSGYRGRRMGAGPLRIAEAGLVDALAAAGGEIRLVPVEIDSDLPTEIASAFQAIRAVRDRVAAARSRGHFPVILAGNCLAGLGAAAALGRPEVYWFDAHGDLNTPDSTRSGFLDGMALSILLGRCWRSLAADSGVEPVTEEQVHLVGVRDLDPAEAESLVGSAIHVWDAESWTGFPGTVADGPCYLHIDLDVLDPTVGMANHYGAPGGLSLEGVLDLVGRLAERGRVEALSLTAYDPSADAEGAIASAAIEIATTVVAGAHDAARSR